MLTHKKKISISNNLTLHLKKLKREKINPNVFRRKVVTKSD